MIAFFILVEPGTNVNAEYKDSRWQVIYAWKSETKHPGWLVLSPTFVHLQDSPIQAMLRRAKPLPAVAGLYFVGWRGGKATVFQSWERPTRESHGEDFAAVTGPFLEEEKARNIANGGWN